MEPPKRFDVEKARLIEEITREGRDVLRPLGRTGFRPEVLQAILEVPREEFVSPDLRHAAYVNAPLPIGKGQTISQPFIVALMTELTDAGPDSIVLDIGTGSGYQAAVLSRLVRRVYAVELIPELAEAARERLARLGYDNIAVRVGDGWEGWPEAAPYDAIVVAAAAPTIPSALIEQLAPGGRLVIPVGEPWTTQELVLVEKQDAKHIRTVPVVPVAFVPLCRPRREH